MKLFHLSDLHLGLKLMNRDLLEDQRYILAQILAFAQAERPDAILIAGDVYDKAVPSAEAVALLDWFLSGLRSRLPEAELLLISGNHDSAPRLDLFRSILCRQRLHMIGNPPRLPEEHIEKLVLEDAWGPVNFYLLPFVRPAMLRAALGTDEALSYDAALHRLLEREKVDRRERNVLLSHQFYVPASVSAAEVERMDSEILTVGNVDAVGADLLEAFDYAALGHIHKPMLLEGNPCRRYCGTPLACSVSEAGQQKGIVAVELGAKGSVETRVLPLTPLRPVLALRGSGEELLAQSCDAYVSATITGNGEPDGAEWPERLRAAFPYLLELRRERQTLPDYEAACAPETALSAFSLCGAFLRELDEEEAALLQDVIHRVQEAQA